MASTNIWTQMGYVPPQGACNHKESLLSAKCSCLRFMIHPLKATTSFECDGCSHHASFHSMENPQETEVIKRWQAAEQERQNSNTGLGSRKRPHRAIENGAPNGSLSFVEELAESSHTTRRPASKKKVTNAQSRTRSTNVIEVDEEVEQGIVLGRESMLGFFTRR